MRAAAIAASVVLLLGACATGSPAPDWEAAEASEHRIGVRVVSPDEAEFYDRETSARWVPRGFNHWQWDYTGGYLMDATFRVGDEHLEQAREDLERMADQGYNAVRIWANACFDVAVGCLGDPAGGLRAQYLQNIAEYLSYAKELDMQVMFTVDNLPDDGGYSELSNEICCDEWNGFNLDLTWQGVADHKKFWHDFVSGLIEVGAPLDAIWAYELRNEQFFEADQPPYGVLTTVQTADGGMYDLTDPGEELSMRHKGLTHYVDTMVDEIKSLDPTALVTMGFFPSSQGPWPTGPGDPRLVDPSPLMTSSIDFIDFHAYPGVGLNWYQAWGNSLLGGVWETPKPVVLGEFGAFRDAYADPADAVAAMVDFQRQACQEGMDGFLYWTWSGQGIYAETWGGDEAGLAAALSPNALPDPCLPGPPTHPNLAFGRWATASSSEYGPEVVGDPSKAFDLSLQTWWSSAADGPQWIEVDLGGATVNRVRLTTRMATEGPMTVDVELLGHYGTVLAVESFSITSTATVPELVLDRSFSPVSGVQRMRVETDRPGWVIWSEIAAFGSR